jgi:hypothetical protein
VGLILAMVILAFVGVCVGTSLLYGGASYNDNAGYGHGRTRRFGR